ncbi:hypothetical protein HSISS1_1714 [Streptococcus sp. HSISS1]|nr:hypothetical protein HSISS1_1714 [Streptococcus sp. HSISS1]
MVPPYDSKHQADSGANTSCLTSYQDLPHVFLPSQSSSALADTSIYSVDETADT